MKRNKKGQETGQAVAVLILVIGLFIVLYILLLPPEERQSLLDVEDKGVGFKAKTILSESPGLVRPSTEETTKHEISSINLFVKSQPEIDFLADSLVIKRSWFGSYFPKIKFDISDVNILNKASLFFKVDNSKGTLRVFLNNEEFYSEKIIDSNLKIIDIPVSLLKDRNEIRFSVDVPLAFWNPNIYELSDVSLKKEFNLVNKQEKRLFSVSQDEKDRISDAELSYFMYCNELEDSSANLDIKLNKRSLFSGLVRCVGNRENVDIDIKDVRKGTNELEFEISDGDFLFSDIFVKTDYRSVNNPIYYFDIDSNNYEDLQDEDVEMILSLKFSSSGEKSARILVNDGEIIVKSDSDSFNRNIEGMVSQGSNFIKIIPLKTFNVDSLKISLE